MNEKKGMKKKCWLITITSYHLRLRLLKSVFSNIVKEFNIKVKEDLLRDSSNINNPFQRASQIYKNHPSMQMIKETLGSNQTNFI